jgi:hypothetical protein
MDSKLSESLSTLIFFGIFPYPVSPTIEDFACSPTDGEPSSDPILSIREDINGSAKK